MTRQGRTFGLALIALVAGASLVFVAKTLRWEPVETLPHWPGANVLLITIDTLRADRVGCYGYRSGATPRLDGLAAEGIRFEQVVAPAPLTLPSHVSLMTAMNPPSHGVRDNGAFQIAARARMLAELFQKADYDTAAFVGAYVLHSRWGLSRGFTTYDDRFDYGGPTTRLILTERRGEAVVRSALDWLARERGAPFFIWVHLYDPHDPYAAPEPFASRFAAQPYDGEVAYSDSLVGQMIDALSRRGQLEKTVVVVTSDHGESLNDHGEPTHGLFLYDATVLVPLILRLPGKTAGGLTVAEQVRLIDVAPTILDLVGVPSPAVFEGRSLLPYLKGRGEPRPAYSETLVPRFHFGWQALYAWRSGGYKYILAPHPELYSLREDPGETDNCVGQEPARAAAMRAKLEKLRGSEPAPVPGALSAEDRRRLRSLGYISAAPAAAQEGSLADPKDKIGVYRSFNRALRLLNSGRTADAVQALERIVSEEPRLVIAQLTLGDARLARKDYASAAEAFETALALHPDYDLALAGLGLARLGLGDRPRARRSFEALLAKDPGNVSALLYLGQMDLEEQKLQSAVRRFEAGLARHDSVAALHFGLGVAVLQLGDVDRAARALGRAASLAPEHTQVHYYLALVAEARGDAAGAVREYRLELKHHPDHYESWFNLSVQLAERGDLTGAVDALRKTISVKPDLAVAHIYLGRALLAFGKPEGYEEAAQAVRHGLALGPPPELRRLGQAILRQIDERRRLQR